MGITLLKEKYLTCLPSGLVRTDILPVNADERRRDYRAVLDCPGIDQPLGSLLLDRSGYNNHGTITEATWKRLPCGLWYLDYDGTDDKILCGTNVAAHKLSVFTASQWVKFDVVNAEQVVSCVFDYDGGYIGWYAGLNSTAKLFFNLCNTSGTRLTTCIGTTSLVANKWYRIAFVNASATSHLIYLNGALEKEDVNNYAVVYASTIRTVVGATWQTNVSAYSRFLNGQVALNKYLNVAQTLAQVLNVYNQERSLFNV